MNDVSLSLLQLGVEIEVRPPGGGRLSEAVFESVTPDGLMRLRLLDSISELGEIIELRCYDDDGAGWKTDARLEHRDNDLLDVRREGEWEVGERRRSGRLATRGPMTAYVSGGDMGTIACFHLTCIDVSAGGCCVRGVGRAPRMGDLLELDLGHDSRHFWIPARVVRVTTAVFGRWEVGFSFLDVPSEARGRLDRWVKSCNERDAVAKAVTELEADAGQGEDAGS